MPSRTLRVPGLTVQLVSADERWLAEVASPLLAPFMSGNASTADATLHVHLSPPRIEVSGNGTVTVETVDLLPCAAEALLCRAFIDRTSDLLLLHAGAAARQGRAVVLPGATRSGKSTLTLAMLGEGWDYLSDDIVPVDPQRAVALPFPRLFHLRPPTLSLVPRLTRTLRFVPLPCRDSEGQPLLLAAPPAEVVSSGRPSIAAVVFSRFAPDAPPGLVRLSPGISAVRLLEHLLNSDTLGASAFHWAVQLSRSIPCYALTHHALEQALQHLNDLVAASS